MGFSDKQVAALRRNINPAHVRTRESNGRELCYVEGWHAINEANRIFGFDGWNRETIESRCVMSREARGAFTVVYTARVRITVHADGQTIVREGHGTGQSQGVSPGETHDIALKGAETDATKRALATFGKPFGLSLYLTAKARPEFSHERRKLAPPPQRPERINPPPPTQLPGLSESEPRKDVVRPVPHQPRHRNKRHLEFVASQPCLLCGRQPSDPHHLRFAQPKALGAKVSDEFVVPLCRIHHRQLHQSGNEVAWWNDLEIDALEIARGLWEQSSNPPAISA